MPKVFGVLASIILLSGCGQMLHDGGVDGGAGDYSDLGNGLSVEELEIEIGNLIQKANYCEQNSDCVFLQEKISLGCPFSCFNLINKKADISRIGLLSDKYFDLRDFDCQAMCVLPPKPEEIKCQNNKCVDIRQ